MSAALEESAEGRAFYIYCVGWNKELSPFFEGVLPASIDGDSKPELIALDEIAAVASAVPLADYGEDALREKLSDPAWMATRVMRHELMVEHFAGQVTVVPLRFGTIYLSRASVERMLNERRTMLHSILDSLDGREEWGINLYVDRAHFREAIVDISPRLLEMRKQADTLSPGRAYMLRKKIDSLRDTEAGEERKRIASEIQTKLMLGIPCAGTARKRLRANEKTEQGEVVGKLIFLLDRRKRKAFRSEAEKLAAKYAPLGFRMELVGPWPAYHFANFGGPVEEGEEGMVPGGRVSHLPSDL